MNRWDTYFLNQALLAAGMSKDPSTQVGAVIVGPDREVRSSGFNGLPRGISADERLCDREVKLQLIVHAEINAIMNAARVGISTKGCTLYVACRDKPTGVIWGGPPCVRCTAEIIQSGVTKIIAHSSKNIPERWKHSVALSRSLLQEAGVEYVEVESEDNT